LRLTRRLFDRGEMPVTRSLQAANNKFKST
jgi:hypothetical protein